MATKVRWILAIAIGAAVVVVPTVRYRMMYENENGFGEVTPGKVCGWGQMSAEGLGKNIREHKIKLVINLQDEYPVPLLPKGYWDAPHIPESQVCAEEGAKFVFIAWAGEK